MTLLFSGGELPRAAAAAALHEFSRMLSGTWCMVVTLQRLCVLHRCPEQPPLCWGLAGSATSASDGQTAAPGSFYWFVWPQSRSIIFIVNFFFFCLPLKFFRWHFFQLFSYFHSSNFLFFCLLIWFIISWLCRLLINSCHILSPFPFYPLL